MRAESFLGTKLKFLEGEMNLNKCVAEEIKRIMKERNLSVKKFAELTGVSVSTTRRLMEEKVRVIRFTVVYKIVDAFNISFDVFLKNFRKK